MFSNPDYTIENNNFKMKDKMNLKIFQNMPNDIKKIITEDVISKMIQN